MSTALIVGLIVIGVGFMLNALGGMRGRSGRVRRWRNILLALIVSAAAFGGVAYLLVSLNSPIF